MSYRSYRRYRRYRANQHWNSMDQMAAIISIMIIMGLITEFWWYIVAVFALILISKIAKFIKSHNSEKSQLIKPNQAINNIQKGENVMNLKSTEAGYENDNKQKNLGRTNMPGTGNNQWFYQMECQNCGHQYYANGHDIWLRKCPKCQGGRP